MKNVQPKILEQTFIVTRNKLKTLSGILINTTILNRNKLA